MTPGLPASEGPGAAEPDLAGLPIPGRLNMAIAITAFATAAGCLHVASHTAHWGSILAAAFVFSLVNNTLFSLLHEAVHGNFHPRRRVNEAAGVLLAAMFPTGFTIQRVSHLGHHRRNRTDLELYDYVLPGESHLLKLYWIYCLLTGFYWAIIPVAGIVNLIVPGAFARRWFREGPARWWGFGPFVGDLARVPPWRIWRELAVTAFVQLSLILVLDLSLFGWLACYWAFGLSWSALQYTDHAWTERDVRNGASNLRVGPIGRLFFLNYHFHLVHHRWPRIPWRYLPRYVRDDDPSPSFWRVYFSLWGGPRPAPPGPGPEPLGANAIGQIGGAP